MNFRTEGTVFRRDGDPALYTIVQVDDTGGPNVALYVREHTPNSYLRQRYYSSPAVGGLIFCNAHWLEGQPEWRILSSLEQLAEAAG